MSKEKLTPWFPGNVKPARAGAYEVGYLSHVKVDVTPCLFPYHYFDGEEWIGAASGKPEVLTGVRDSIVSAYGDNCFWRGLAEPPKEQA